MLSRQVPERPRAMEKSRLWRVEPKRLDLLASGKKRESVLLKGLTLTARGKPGKQCLYKLINDMVVCKLGWIGLGENACREEAQKETAQESLSGRLHVNGWVEVFGRLMISQERSETRADGLEEGAKECSQFRVARGFGEHGQSESPAFIHKGEKSVSGSSEYLTDRAVISGFEEGIKRFKRCIFGEDCAEKICFSGEIVVEQSFGNSASFRNVPDRRCAIAVFGEKEKRCFQQLLAPLCCLGLTFCARWRTHSVPRCSGNDVDMVWLATLARACS